MNCPWCKEEMIVTTVSAYTLEEQTSPSGGYVNHQYAAVCNTPGCRARGPMRRSVEEAETAWLREFIEE